MEECELAKAYNEAEQRWQSWRKLHPNDMRRGLDYSGSSEEESIAANWCTLELLLDEWKSTHLAPFGYFWGISCIFGPSLMKSAPAPTPVL